MTVTVLLFAGLRDAVGNDELEVEVKDDHRLSDLWTQLEEAHPAASAYRGRVVFAVADRVVSDQTSLDQVSEVAILPPISGG